MTVLTFSNTFYRVNDITINKRTYKITMQPTENDKTQQSHHLGSAVLYRSSMAYIQDEKF